MHQFYLNIRDIIPTEGEWVYPSENPIDPVEKDHFSYLCWLDDIEQNGIQFALKVRPDGQIADGNFRYWCARDLFLKGNFAFEYLPVDIWYYLGLEKRSCLITLNGDIEDNIPKSIYGKKKIYTHKNKLWSGDKDYLKHGDNNILEIPQKYYKDILED